MSALVRLRLAQPRSVWLGLQETHDEGLTLLRGQIERREATARRTVRPDDTRRSPRCLCTISRRLPMRATRPTVCSCSTRRTTPLPNIRLERRRSPAPGGLDVRSLTKEHALAGLRLAFAIGPAHVIEAMNRVRVPWSASSVAQAAATAAFSDEAADHVAQTVRILRSEASRLRASCAELGFTPHPSATHYFVLRVATRAP